MMTGFKPKLISVDITNNYLEAGEILYITVKWQNIGDRAADFCGRISADLFFDRDTRHPENLTDSFRAEWNPFPATYDWQPGETISTTGKWKVPDTWCGPFWLNIGIVAENGEMILFEGKNGKNVYREEITDIDLGWGWGHVMLVAQRHPVHVDISVPEKASFEAQKHETVLLGGYRFLKKFPAIVNDLSDIYEKISLPIVTLLDNEELSVKKCLNDDMKPKFSEAIIEENSIKYTVNGIFGKAELVFEYKNNVLYISIDNVENTGIYKLVSIYIPRIAVFSDEGNLVNFYSGGRCVPIKNELPYSAIFNYDVCCATAGYDLKNSYAFIADDMETSIIQSVEEINGIKRGVIGCEIKVLLPAISKNAVSIPVQKLPTELHRLEKGSWYSFGELIRNRLPEVKLDKYKNTLFYKISADKTLEADPNRPITWSKPLLFAQVKEIIEKIYNITGGMKQVVYLVGWQRRGHDTEYPFPHKYEFSPYVGSYEEWLDCFEFAKAHNTVLSFHDNFDDAYVLDEIKDGMVAIDRRGRLKRGWLWAGGMSYILSPKGYNLSGEMSKRVKETLERFGITESYHLDVLTAEARRYDYSEKYNSASLENIEYKKKVVKKFAEYGVDITSEALCLPFVGTIEYFLHSKYSFGEKLFLNEKTIPLTTLVFHGKTRYCMGSVGKENLIKAVTYGGTCGLDCLSTDIGTDHIRGLYLHTMPMQLLSEKEVSGYTVNGSKIRIDYGCDSYVEVNSESCEYVIVADGKKVVDNGTAILPAFDGTEDILIYSEKDAEITVSYPAELALVTKLSLYGSTSSETLKPDNGKLTLSVSADVPLRISLK